MMMTLLLMMCMSNYYSVGKYDDVPDDDHYVCVMMTNEADDIIEIIFCNIISLQCIDIPNDNDIYS